MAVLTRIGLVQDQTSNAAHVMEGPLVSARSWLREEELLYLEDMAFISLLMPQWMATHQLTHTALID